MKQVSLIACALAFVAGAVQAAVVIDGDTLDNDGHRWRLAGVNCPETGTTAGSAASAAARFIVQERTVTCIQRGNETTHGRLVGYCSVEGLDLGQALIESGVCGRCPRFDPDGRYIEAQRRGDYAGFFPKYCKKK